MEQLCKSIGVFCIYLSLTVLILAVTIALIGFFCFVLYVLVMEFLDTFELDFSDVWNWFKRLFRRHKA